MQWREKGAGSAQLGIKGLPVAPWVRQQEKAWVHYLLSRSGELSECRVLRMGAKSGFATVDTRPGIQQAKAREGETVLNSK